MGVDRVARHQADQPIDGERHDGQHDDRLQQAAGEKTGHSSARHSSIQSVVGYWCPVGVTPFSHFGKT